MAVILFAGTITLGREAGTVISLLLKPLSPEGRN